LQFLHRFAKTPAKPLPSTVDANALGYINRSLPTSKAEVPDPLV